MQRAWYAKLEASGFKDAEELVEGELELKQTPAKPCCFMDSDLIVDSNLADPPREDIAAKQDYFRIIWQKSQEASFSSNVDRIILTMFAEGAKVNQIIGELESLGAKRCRMTIRTTIRRYEVQWGLREYTPLQLGQWSGRPAQRSKRRTA